MLTGIVPKDVKNPLVPKEGDLYKEITIGDKIFRLLYGYYESFERDNPANEPIPLYPDFIKEPQYTSEGIPIVTAMQNTCEFYNEQHDEDSSCSDCDFFQSSEELFGFCYCPENKRSCKERVVVNDE